MVEIGQESVDFSTLVIRAAEESYLSLKELVEKSKSSEMSDSEKKISILKYVVKTQQRMLRLNVLAQWCQQMLDYNVPGGKLNRGLSVVDSYKLLKGEELTEDELFLSSALGWCIEWVITYEY